VEVGAIDHLVLTVRDVSETLEFYQKVLGMEPVRFGEGRVALRFGNQKINLHGLGEELEPKAANATPGTADLCFVTSVQLPQAMSHVRSCGVEIIEGPVSRTGANGKLLSFYFRDPSGNLIEVANEV
jgi:catechol 2,3-dioxygenase-like lactoylglutathione lyase family enzyme